MHGSIRRVRPKLKAYVAASYSTYRSAEPALFALFFAPVSVGPSGIAVPLQAVGEAGTPMAPGNPPGAPEPEKIVREGASDGAESTPESTSTPLSRHGGIAAAVVATVAAGRIGTAVGRGRRRGFAEFSEQARVR